MKVRRNGVRSFLCSRSARPQKGLARRPQSKAPHAVVWLGIELEKRVRMACTSENQPASHRAFPASPARLPLVSTTR
jgi:hypothetical protein